MLILTLPNNRERERKWVGEVILRDFLGQEVACRFDSVPLPVLTLNDHVGRLVLSDKFFLEHQTKWLDPDNLPENTCGVIGSDQLNGLESNVELPLPVLFGDIIEGAPIFEFKHGDGFLRIDVLGTAFFMLSRYEEVARPQEDSHQRFPASASMASKAGFLDRPIVDEHVEMLWTAMKRIWPGLERRQHFGDILVSCDVDVPFDPSLNSLLSFMRKAATDYIKMRDTKAALGRIANFARYRLGRDHVDTYNTFDWYLDACEKAGLRAHFYFLAGKTHPPTDAKYHLGETFIKKLLRKIAQRGHEIGLHGSYMTFRDPSQIRKERDNLEMACSQAGIEVTIDTNRQHFLRWDSAQTPDHLAAAGITLDSTGGFADCAGFRYGTARRFRMWSWIKNQQISLQQQPLILMECSVIGERYQNLGYTKEAIELMLRLKTRALRYGNFSMLWHNSHLTTEQDRLFFATLRQPTLDAFEK